MKQLFPSQDDDPATLFVPSPSQVPWVSGFPFNVCSHPQYVGSVMTIWAVTALLWNHSPPALITIALYWTGLYVLTGYFEEIQC